MPIKDRFKAAKIAGLLVLAAPWASAGTYYPKPGLFNTSTGYLETEMADGWFRGSAVVARDPRLIYSCGHMLYENGMWATDYLFYRAYNSRYSPDPSTAATPRGYRYFTSYSNNVDIYGQDSGRAFAFDFTVFYGTSSFGPAVGWWSDGGGVMRSDRKKLIVGYPSRLEYNNARGYYYQHGTGWFTNRAVQTRGAYHYFKNVTTGGGNSGGPVFAKDTDGKYYLGGILVSGNSNTAGIYALNSSSNSMASAALATKSVRGDSGNTNSVALPDASSTYLVREVTTSGFSENITDLKFSASISTPRRGDLDVYLRSPSGRIRWVHKQSKEAAADLRIDNADYSAKFRGQAANGVWQLKMRDAVSGNRATFNNFSVSVSAAGE
ncbi:MAG: proprotein convertase P-domain-containing protein [Luteolibacter sp.]